MSETIAKQNILSTFNFLSNRQNFLNLNQEIIKRKKEINIVVLHLNNNENLITRRVSN